MPTISQEQIEVMAEQLGQLEAEITSYIDELAEVRQENEALKEAVNRLRKERDG